MKVKTTKDLFTKKGYIHTGTVLNVSDIFRTSEFYLITEGYFSGVALPVKAVEAVEKTYTEKEVEDIKSYWEKEVKTLKFFVNTLADCLLTASDEIDRLRKELEKAK